MRGSFIWTKFIYGVLLAYWMTTTYIRQWIIIQNTWYFKNIIS